MSHTKRDVTATPETSRTSSVISVHCIVWRLQNSVQGTRVQSCILRQVNFQHGRLSLLELPVVVTVAVMEKGILKPKVKYVLQR